MQYVDKPMPSFTIVPYEQIRPKDKPKKKMPNRYSVCQRQHMKAFFCHTVARSVVGGQLVAI